MIDAISVTLIAIGFMALIFGVYEGVNYLFKLGRKRNRLEEKEKERLPHEIFPQLMHWQKDDELTRDAEAWRGKPCWSCSHNYNTVRNQPAVFIGIYDGMVCGRMKDEDEVFKLSPSKASFELENKAAKKRHADFEVKLIEHNISNDDYNVFLSALKETNSKLLEA